MKVKGKKEGEIYIFTVTFYPAYTGLCVVCVVFIHRTIFYFNVLTFTFEKTYLFYC